MSVTCPICDTDLDDAIEADLRNGNLDYRTYFDYECTNCETVLEVEVRAEPSFHLLRVRKEMKDVRT